MPESVFGCLFYSLLVFTHPSAFHRRHMTPATNTSPPRRGGPTELDFSPLSPNSGSLSCPFVHPISLQPPAQPLTELSFSGRLIVHIHCGYHPGGPSHTLLNSPPCATIPCHSAHSSIQIDRSIATPTLGGQRSTPLLARLISNASADATSTTVTWVSFSRTIATRVLLPL